MISDPESQGKDTEAFFFFNFKELFSLWASSLF